MRQFLVYQNLNPASNKFYPYLVNVQNDLIQEMETRAAIPLYPAKSRRMPAMSSLSPLFEIERRQYILMTPLIAGISTERFGKAVADFSQQRSAIMAAIDLLISGI